MRGETKQVTERAAIALMAVRTMGRFQVDVGHNLILIYKIITWANTLKNGLCDARETR